MDSVLLIYASLIGFGALVSFLVGLFKIFGWVKDGTADKWVAGLNLVGLVAVFVLGTFFPQIDLKALDANIASLVGVLSIILAYVTTLLGSKLTYFATRGLPVIGKSFS
jgi:hypothetical protein